MNLIQSKSLDAATQKMAEALLPLSEEVRNSQLLEKILAELVEIRRSLVRIERLNAVSPGALP